MQVGTYNVFGLRGYPREEGDVQPLTREPCVERFADAFAALECDLLGLQEGHPCLSSMQAVAGAMGDVRLAAFASPVDWPGYLLSRHRILESRIWSHFQPDARSAPLSRCAGAALVDVGEDEPWAVAVIHLHPRQESRDRREQEAALLESRIGELTALTSRVVVMGDFNSEVDERIHAHLKDRGFVNAMEAAGGGLEPTVKAAGPGTRPIDHIYLSPTLGPRLSAARVVRDPGFYHPEADAEPRSLHSDHLPVVATLESP